MLISTISFEIHDVRNNRLETCLIENTEANQHKVFTHRQTRNILFSKVFDFEFVQKRHMPVEFIDFSTEEENELDMVDEMVGAF